MANTNVIVNDALRSWKIFFMVLCILIHSIIPAHSSNQNCVVKGQIYTKLNWYGYLVQKTFKKSDGRITYQISYPVSECCVNLLIYYDDQIRDLKEGMTCKQREGILPADNNQKIPLSINGINATTGCQIWNKTKEPQYLCTGERSFRSGGPRTWYLAVSRCDATTPLSLNYYFNLSGFYGDCEVDPLTKTVIPEVHAYNYDIGVIIGLGVVCGITTILAVVFIVLFFFSYRRRKDKKGGSVTSSQATMTQDIFYVNPSLSDREQSDSQYSHSQSSGSENYYEVIPDRRSYESINTQLALQGHGLRLNAAHLKDGRHHHIPAYILEDYPPPPYQPPNLQNGIHHRQSSAHAILQSGGHYAHNPHALHTLPNGHARAVHPNVRPLSQHFAHHVCPPTSGSAYQPGQGLHVQQQQQAAQGIQQQQQQAETQTQQQQQPKTHAVRPSSRTSGKSPVHSESPHSNSRTPPVPNGTVANTENQQTRANQQHITTPKSPQSGHTNEGFVRQFSTPISKTATNGQHIQLQTYGQNQNPGQNRATGVTQTPNRATGVTQTPNGRPHLPNGNVAKLLHDAYRIQQFETTA